MGNTTHPHGCGDRGRCGAGSKRLRRLAMAAACAAALAACDDSGEDLAGRGDDTAGGTTEVVQTHFPGQVTAGGGTSGQVLARLHETTGTATGTADSAPGEGGTPGIPKGSGGTTDGAALGGTNPDSPLAGSGRKTAAQSPATDAAASESATLPPSPAAR